MKIIGKRLLSAVLFLAILFCMINWSGLIVRPGNSGSDNWSEFYAEDKNTSNVLVLGSSAAYRYWIPTIAYEEQHFTSLMLAQSEQPIEAVPYLMEELVKTQDADLIVVETRQVFAKLADKYEDKFNQEASTYFFSLIAMGMNQSMTRVQMINHLLQEDEANEKLEWIFPLLKYHDNALKMSPKKFLTRLCPKKSPIKSAKPSAQVTVYPDPEIDPNADYHLQEQDKKNIDLIVEKANELGKEVLFVSMPYITTKYRYPLQMQLDAYMEEKGYPYVNLQVMQDEIGLNKETDFMNRNHVNIVGARKVTSYLADYLAKNYIFPDRLNEEQKKEWDQACINWQKKEDTFLQKWEDNCKNE